MAPLHTVHDLFRIVQHPEACRLPVRPCMLSGPFPFRRAYLRAEVFPKDDALLVVGSILQVEEDEVPPESDESGSESDATDTTCAVEAHHSDLDGGISFPEDEWYEDVSLAQITSLASSSSERRSGEVADAQPAADDRSTLRRSRLEVNSGLPGDWQDAVHPQDSSVPICRDSAPRLTSEMLGWSEIPLGFLIEDAVPSHWAWVPFSGGRAMYASTHDAQGGLSGLRQSSLPSGADPVEDTGSDDVVSFMQRQAGCSSARSHSPAMMNVSDGLPPPSHTITRLRDIASQSSNEEPSLTVLTWFVAMDASVCQQPVEVHLSGNADYWEDTQTPAY